ncbi:MAG: zinc-binding dehydrogenase [Myxococcota bacterium]
MQRRDSAADGGGVDAQRLAGAGMARVALHGEEDAQVVPAHACIIARISDWGCVPAAWPCNFGGFRSAPGNRILGRMFAYTFRQRLALDDLAVVERPTPEPGPRDLVLAMRAASLNYRDLAIARDGYGAFRAPLVPLSDGAGVVVARGPEVTRPRARRPGVPGLRARLARRPARARGRAPLPGRPPTTASWPSACACTRTTPCAPRATSTPSTPRRCPSPPSPPGSPRRRRDAHPPGRRRRRAGHGRRLAFVLQLAHAAGARVLVGSATRRGCRASRRSAQRPSSRPTPRLAAALLERTGRRGVDLLVDVVRPSSARPSRRRASAAASRWWASWAAPRRRSIGWAAIRRALTLRAVSVGSRASFEALVRALEAGGIVPVVDAVVPFADALDAYRRLEHGRPFGKVVIAFDVR